MVTAKAMLGFFGAPEDGAPSSIRYGSRIRVPALVLHGDRDELSLPPNAQTIYDSLLTAPRRDLVWVKDASHYLTPGGAAEAYAGCLRDWLVRNMPA